MLTADHHRKNFGKQNHIKMILVSSEGAIVPLIEHTYVGNEPSFDF